MGEPFEPDVSPAFWEMIDRADGDGARLRELLGALGRLDLICFYRDYRIARNDLEDRVDSARPDEIDEDELRQGGGWVVTQGKAYYQRVYHDPSMFPDWAVITAKPADAGGAALNVFAERFGADMPGDFWSAWRADAAPGAVADGGGV